MEHYADFELEVDSKVDPLLNSGIQIRSNTYENETTTVRWGGVDEQVCAWNYIMFYLAP